MTRRQEPEIVVGVIGAPYGVRGEMRVRLETDFPETLANRGEIHLRSPSGEWAVCRIESLRVLRGERDAAIVRFEGVSSRDEAQSLRGCEMRIFREQRADLPRDTYYTDDLIGLEVIATDGRSLGKITEVLRQPANDVLVTESALIPALKSVVLEIDIAAGRVIVEAVPGLLDSED